MGLLLFLYENSSKMNNPYLKKFITDRKICKALLVVAVKTFMYFLQNKV